MMGGLVFYGSYDDDTPKSLFERSTDPRCTVDVPSYAGFIYIMEHFPHIITDITEEYILDHAASSSLSEALLVVQVAWFCTNCASRLFQRLPLSLLEVSTAAHSPYLLCVVVKTYQCCHTYVMSQISKLGHKDLIRYFWAADLIRLMSSYKIDPLNTL